MAERGRPYRPQKIEKGSQISPVNVHDPKPMPKPPPPPPPPPSK
jgi:hypothetical protein